MSEIILSALLNSAILSLGLVAILSLALQLYGNQFWNASTRYAAWLVALVVTVGLPFAYTAHSFWTLEQVSQSAPDSSAVAMPKLKGLPEIVEPGDGSRTPGYAPGARPWFSMSRFEIPSGPWIGWILGAWVLAATVMLLRLCVSYVWLHRRKERAMPAPAFIRSQDWLKRCGSERRIDVKASEEIAAPVAAGPFRPLILIPTPLLEELHPEELEQICVHEAAHFARRDDYALLFQRTCEALFVFHPLVRLIAARLDFEREIACDDFVIQTTGRPRPYAECLTRVAAIAGGHAAPSLAAPAVHTRSVLERRLDMLLDKNRRRAPQMLKAPLAVLLVLTSAILLAVLAGPQLVTFAQVAGEPAAAPPPPSPASPAAAVPARQQTTTTPKPEARDYVNRGVESFRARDFQTAVDYFGRAAQMDPDFTVAELYLGTAYAALYVPGAPVPGDYSYRSIRAFENVLTKDPKNVDALIGLATIYQYRNDYKAARENLLKATALAPRNTDVLYSIGALDWILVYDKTTPPTPQEQAQWIEEGLQSLDKALALDTRFEEAMTYKNLLLRQKAKLTSDPLEQVALTDQATDWFNKALEARRQNVQDGRQRQNSSVAGLVFPPPQPPPPPPPAPSRTVRGTEVEVVAALTGGFVGVMPPNSPPPQRIGGDVAQASLLSQAKPVYPALAKAARVQDYVMFQAVIDKQGAVADLKILHGHPLLNDAAMDAVRQWRYKPQVVNGQAIDVITTVTVNFSFQ